MTTLVEISATREQIALFVHPFARSVSLCRCVD